MNGSKKSTLDLINHDLQYCMGSNVTETKVVLSSCGSDGFLDANDLTRHVHKSCDTFIDYNYPRLQSPQKQ